MTPEQPANVELQPDREQHESQTGLSDTLKLGHFRHTRESQEEACREKANQWGQTQHRCDRSPGERGTQVDEPRLH
jgi:hypothetical protein